MKIKFRVVYYALGKHCMFGHTRFHGIWEGFAVDESDARGKADADASRKFERVREEDFEPTETHSYPEKDEFIVTEIG